MAQNIKSSLDKLNFTRFFTVMQALEEKSESIPALSRLLTQKVPEYNASGSKAFWFKEELSDKVHKEHLGQYWQIKRYLQPDDFWPEEVISSLQYVAAYPNRARDSEGRRRIQYPRDKRMMSQALKYCVDQLDAYIEDHKTELGKQYETARGHIANLRDCLQLMKGSAPAAQALLDRVPAQLRRRATELE